MSDQRLEFKISPEFFDSCHGLGTLPQAHVLLMDNAAIPWLLLIPETFEVELCDLAPEQHDQILNYVRVLSLSLRRHFDIDKLNIACNGNVVRQMHLHVIGRRFDDYCWPDVVIGTAPPRSYENDEIKQFAEVLANDPELARHGYQTVAIDG